MKDGTGLNNKKEQTRSDSKYVPPDVETQTPRKIDIGPQKYIKKMIVAARKYDITFNTLEILRNTKHSLPIWYHIAFEGDEAHWNDRWFGCHRRHIIASVGDLQDYVKEKMPEEHEIS